MLISLVCETIIASPCNMLNRECGWQYLRTDIQKDFENVFASRSLIRFTWSNFGSVEIKPQEMKGMFAEIYGKFRLNDILALKVEKAHLKKPTNIVSVARRTWLWKRSNFWWCFPLDTVTRYVLTNKYYLYLKSFWEQISQGTDCMHATYKKWVSC